MYAAIFQKKMVQQRYIYDEFRSVWLLWDEDLKICVTQKWFVYWLYFHSSLSFSVGGTPARSLSKAKYPYNQPYWSCYKDKEDKDLFIGPQEFVVGYSKAPEQPQSSARPICHSHTMTRMGRELGGARHATHCAMGDDDVMQKFVKVLVV